VRQDRTRALVRAVGEWDLANAEVLDDLLRTHEKAGRRYVRLDVSSVKFLDCTCLGVLVAAHRRLLAERGTLVLTGVTPRIVRLLRLARLEQVLLTTSLSDLDVQPDHRVTPIHRSMVRPA
jgi:anti-sigma B factor antagonist